MDRWMNAWMHGCMDNALLKFIQSGKINILKHLGLAENSPDNFNTH